MVPEGSRPVVEIAAGTHCGGLGTDATAVAAAIERAGNPEGVLVLMDLGSAVMSADLALELLVDEQPGRVALTSAPLVEGLVAAVVTASSGATLRQVLDEAEGALDAKTGHLDSTHGHRHLDDSELDDPEVLHGGATAEVEVRNLHGLHARPAAAIASVAAGFGARVQLTNQTQNRGPAYATSVTRVTALGLARGHRRLVRAVGDDQSEAVAAIVEVVEGWVDSDETVVAPAGVNTGRQVVSGPALVQLAAAGDYMRSTDEVAAAAGCTNWPPSSRSIRCRWS